MNSLRIINHNMYWGQGHPSLWGNEQQRHHPESLSELLQFYRSLNADLICLQEFPNRALLKVFCRELNMRGEYVAGGTFSAYGNVVMHNQDNLSVEDLSNMEIATDRVFERSVMSVNVDTPRGPLRLVNMHGASPRYAPGRNAEVNQKLEYGEILKLVPKADIILGDLNFRTDTSIYRLFSDAGYADTGKATCEGDYPLARLTEYVWLEERHRDRIGEVLFSSDEVETYTRDRGWRLSDHPPGLLELEF